MAGSSVAPLAQVCTASHLPSVRPAEWRVAVGEVPGADEVASRAVARVRTLQILPALRLLLDRDAAGIASILRSGGTRGPRAEGDALP